MKRLRNSEVPIIMQLLATHNLKIVLHDEGVLAIRCHGKIAQSQQTLTFERLPKYAHRNRSFTSNKCR